MDESRSPAIGRRALLRAGALAGLSFSVLGSLAVAARYLWPGGQATLPRGVFRVRRAALPGPGDPSLHVGEAKAWVVLLQPGEGAWQGMGQPADRPGYLALSRTCTHLPCTVPWLADFQIRGQRGWFRCPCHQGTFTRAGIQVFGPPPRPLDTFAIAFDERGNLLIDTNRITEGGDDNALRSLRPG